MKNKLSDRQLNQLIRDLKNENLRLKETVNTLEEDSKIIKADLVINNFRELKKQDILAMTDNQRMTLIFKVLKALVWQQYDVEE